MDCQRKKSDFIIKKIKEDIFNIAKNNLLEIESEMFKYSIEEVLHFNISFSETWGLNFWEELKMVSSDEEYIRILNIN